MPFISISYKFDEDGSLRYHQEREFVLVTIKVGLILVGIKLELVLVGIKLVLIFVGVKLGLTMF